VFLGAWIAGGRESEFEGWLVRGLVAGGDFGVGGVFSHGCSQMNTDRAEIILGLWIAGSESRCLKSVVSEGSWLVGVTGCGVGCWWAEFLGAGWCSRFLATDVHG
jgi:hypothetical protein